ncbi:putative membrane-anchored protein [Neolewinella xylanilytica]|uniref:Putative membrane-anchored protein n=1 Tax=Neolewinella xylanilytica TaxID=1514080 RepID=A0A2S6I3L9_9BACT|nr:GDYXXLXY domain-containing protein [Neolewinella xylanilytica]PPK85782.1 putative membrane-anchored protein [Neolewinella xylanilytica]
MTSLRRGTLIFGILAVLGYTAWFVYDKERILAEGELVLFELAPVDPRSLLQGDYMRLAYEIDAGLSRETLPPGGYLVYTLDDTGVARFRRIQSKLTPLREAEGLIQFRRRRAGSIRNGTIRLGAESYFFEEGSGDRFARAQYGGMRIDGRGRAVLVGLWDEDRQLIR